MTAAARGFFSQDLGAAFVARHGNDDGALLSHEICGFVHLARYQLFREMIVLYGLTAIKVQKSIIRHYSVYAQYQRHFSQKL